MSKIIEKVNALESRLSEIKCKNTPENRYGGTYDFESRVNEFILDFKTLVYNTDPEAPIYEAVKAVHLNSTYGFEEGLDLVSSLEFLLGKFRQYNSEE